MAGFETALVDAKTDSFVPTVILMDRWVRGLSNNTECHVGLFPITRTTWSDSRCFKVIYHTLTLHFSTPIHRAGDTEIKTAETEDPLNMYIWRLVYYACGCRHPDSPERAWERR